MGEKHDAVKLKEMCSEVEAELRRGKKALAILDRLYRQFDRFDTFHSAMTVCLKITPKDGVTMGEIKEALK